jgi:hypothetical protein
MNARAPIPELAKHLRAIEEDDREWMAEDRIDEIAFLCEIVSSHSISAREAARRRDQTLLGTHLRHAREGLILALKTFNALPPKVS